MKSLVVLLLAISAAFAAEPIKQHRCYRGMVLHFDHSPYEDTVIESGVTVKGERSCLKEFSDPSKGDDLKLCLRKAQFNAVRYYKDGLLMVARNGTVAAAVRYTKAAEAPCITVANYAGKLIIPGFLDCHNHFPQVDMIASFGGNLMDWLGEYVFAAESRNVDTQYAKKNSVRVFNQLARSGTTTGLFYNVVFKDAVAAFFDEAVKRKVRMISGVNGMANCADPVLKVKPYDSTFPLCNSRNFSDTFGELSAQVYYEDTKTLYRKYHKPTLPRGRQMVGNIPRFLNTDTPAMLEACKLLQDEFPDMVFHTHVSEELSKAVIDVQLWREGVKGREGFPSNGWIDAWYNKRPLSATTQRFLRSMGLTKDQMVARLLNASTEMQMHDAYGLVTRLSTWAHGVHLTERDHELMEQNSARPCHCPPSNLFLGSGLFDMASYVKRGIVVGMGTDVGGGNTYHMLRVMNEMYKVAMTPGEAAGNFPAGMSGSFNNDEWTGNLTYMAENTRFLTKDPRIRIPYKEIYKPYPLTQIFLITLGTAVQLRLDPYIGNFASGKEADFVVLDPAFMPLYRWNAEVIQTYLSKQYNATAEADWKDPAFSRSWLKSSQELFEVFMLERLIFPMVIQSDDRVVQATYILGRKSYDREVNYDMNLFSDYQSKIRNSFGPEWGRLQDGAAGALPAVGTLPNVSLTPAMLALLVFIVLAIVSMSVVAVVGVLLWARGKSVGKAVPMHWYPCNTTPDAQ